MPGNEKSPSRTLHIQLFLARGDAEDGDGGGGGVFSSSSSWRWRDNRCACCSLSLSLWGSCFLWQAAHMHFAAAAAILSLSSSFWCERCGDGGRHRRRQHRTSEGGKEGRGRAHTHTALTLLLREGVTAQTIERKEMRFGPGRTVAACSKSKFYQLELGQPRWNVCTDRVSKCTKLEIDSSAGRPLLWRTERGRQKEWAIDARICQLLILLSGACISIASINSQFNK